MSRSFDLVALGAASDVQLDEMGAEAVFEAKSSGGQLMSTATAENVERSENLYRFLLSTEEVNRRGDIIRQSGLDFRNWERNPVVLHNHDDDMPIGLGRVVRDGPKTWMDVQFSEVSERAKLIRAMTDEGIFRAASIAIMPRKVSNPREAAERERLGLGKYGVVYETSEVYEGSIVTIPADPAAVRNALVRRGFDEAAAERFSSDLRPTERDLVRRLRHVQAPSVPPWVERLEAALELMTTRIEHAARASARRESEDSKTAAPASGIPLSLFLSSLNEQVNMRLSRKD